MKISERENSSKCLMDTVIGKRLSKSLESHVYLSRFYTVLVGAETTATNRFLVDVHGLPSSHRSFGRLLYAVA